MTLIDDFYCKFSFSSQQICIKSMVWSVESPWILLLEIKILQLLNDVFFSFLAEKRYKFRITFFRTHLSPLDFPKRKKKIAPNCTVGLQQLKVWTFWSGKEIVVLQKIPEKKCDCTFTAFQYLEKKRRKVYVCSCRDHVSVRRHCRHQTSLNALWLLVAECL